MAAASRGTYTKKLIVVGENGNGKSQTCNTILGKDIFDGTKRHRLTPCEFCHLSLKSLKVWIVDTPGMFEPDSILAERALEIQQAVEECPNPHAFLIVIKAELLTTETDRFIHTLDMLEVIFGDTCLKHAIIVVTHGAHFKTEGDFENIWKHDKLKKIYNRCNHHVARIDNKETPSKKREAVNKLFVMIDKVCRMGNFVYTNEGLEHHKQALENHLKSCDPEESHEIQIKKLKEQLEDYLRVYEPVETKK